MSAVPKHKFTPQEYLAFERAAETRHEYFQGEIFDMAGASYEHTVVKDNLARELGNRFKDGSCRPLTSDLRLKIDATGLYTYPDIIVLCGKPEFEDAEFDILLNPTAVIEVLSESTEKYDRGKRFKHYQSVPSIREYVLVAQDEMLIERYVRQPDETWVITTFKGPDAVFSFATIPVSVPFEGIYQGVEFERK
ncbi:MAG TPA: Uma2 family endonuclease [Fimbriiglobus sp.]|jgi:Uma2 family endonuclease